MTPAGAVPGGDGAEPRTPPPQAAAAVPTPPSGPAATRPRRRLRLRKREEEYYDGPFARAAKWLLARGVHPNHLTFLQLPVFLAQILAATQGWSWTFVGLMAAVIFLDAGDGVLARVGKLQSKQGAQLDSIFDTLGIAVVMWGASRFFPDQQLWLMLLFMGNIVLFLQNALLEEKVISYLRGPILVAVAFPATLLGGLVLPSVTIAFLLVVRLPATFRSLGRLLPTP